MKINNLQSLFFLAILFIALGSTGYETKEDVEIATFVPPERVELKLPNYPMNQRQTHGEGWVFVQFMVGTDGKPYEIEVVDSMGSRSFERAAVKSVERWKYKPATYNGTPVDSSEITKIRFHIDPPAKGASANFISRYRQISKLISN